MTGKSKGRTKRSGDTKVKCGQEQSLQTVGQKPRTKKSDTFTESTSSKRTLL